MRVLGILPTELRPKDVTAFGGSDVKAKFFEQKRLNLIDEVKRKAESAPDVHGKHGADGGMTREERNALFLEQVAKTEQENMTRMAKLAKKDVQSVVIQELETKLAAFNNKKRQEEGASRVKESLKARDDALAARKKLQDKKKERITDVRNKANQAVLSHSMELLETLRKNNERAEKSIQAIAESRTEGRGAKQEKRDLAWTRVDSYSADLVAKREHAYAELCQKMDSQVQRSQELSSSRQSHADEANAKLESCHEHVRVSAEQKQAAAEAKYWKAITRHGEAAKSRDEELKTRIKEFQVRNVKRKQAHEGRYVKIQSDIDKNIARKYEEFEKKEQEFEKTRALAKASSAADLQRFFDHREDIIDLAAMNRERLRRAHHYSVEQQLDKLVQMRRKVQIMQNAKTEADTRRMVVMAKCAVEKMHLTDRVDRVKNSKDPDKMQSMLEELDPDPDAIGKINELLAELGMQTLGFVKDEEEGK